MSPDTSPEPPTVRMLEDAGYRIEGPGSADVDALRCRYWWTLMRDGWSGIECGPDFGSEVEAMQDATAALLEDADLDWDACAVLKHAVDQFPADFAASMKAWRSSGGDLRRP